MNGPEPTVPPDAALSRAGKGRIRNGISDSAAARRGPLIAAALAALLRHAIVLFSRLVTGVQVRWSGCGPEPVQRIYYANHTSNGDSILLWTALAPAQRRRTRPVAAADYWAGGSIRRFVAKAVFRSVLIERKEVTRGNNPLSALIGSLDTGASLIVFPEGTRNTGGRTALPFKSGIYHLARARPDVELVPVWIANLNRVLPKGEILPIPLLCTVTFGKPLRLNDGESKPSFLSRARDALLDLAPQTEETAR